MSDPSVLAAIVAGLAAVVGAWFAYRASTKANQLADRKVDMEAYDRNIVYYEKLIANLEKDVERFRTSVDRVNAQLAQEQDVSNALRNQVRTMQAQLDLLERTLNEYRTSPARPQMMEGQ
ncbi:hypothetical protein [Nonomuraea sp. NPDC050643]|uniref:hypothetical protein n=1 Tax=Nonomuraea sp. NPDC050643 TaxID=3155660 RepID=UPI0033E8C62C